VHQLLLAQVRQLWKEAPPTALAGRRHKKRNHRLLSVSISKVPQTDENAVRLHKLPAIDYRYRYSRVLGH